MQALETKEQPTHLDIPAENDYDKTGNQEEPPAYVPNAAEEKRLVRKIDRHLLPMLWVMYM